MCHDFNHACRHVVFFWLKIFKKWGAALKKMLWTGRFLLFHCLGCKYWAAWCLCLLPFGCLCLFSFSPFLPLLFPEVSYEKYQEKSSCAHLLSPQVVLPFGAILQKIVWCLLRAFWKDKKIHFQTIDVIHTLFIIQMLSLCTVLALNWTRKNYFFC